MPRRKPLLIAGIGGRLVLSWPLSWALYHPSSVSWNFAGQLGFTVLIGLFGGALPVTMVETTPREVRCSAISFGYNLGVGTYYIMAAALISLVIAVSLPKMTKAEV
jgi:MHS family proline/betaine transporter-like MFS transporter